MSATRGIAACATAMLALAACATPPRPSQPAPSIQVEQSAVRWVSGPTPEVRTLLLEPLSVGEVGGPALSSADLSIGAFFSRYSTAQGPLDQLALLVQLDGNDPMQLLAAETSLLLEMDGVIFQGQPGLTGNTLNWTTTEDGRRATMVIPIPLSALEALTRSSDVRGRVGLWGAFGFPHEVRDRFQEIVDGLPDGAPIVFGAPAPRRIIAAASSGDTQD